MTFTYYFCDKGAVPRASLSPDERVVRRVAPDAHQALAAAFVCGLVRATSWTVGGAASSGRALSALVEVCHFLALGLHCALWLGAASWLGRAASSRKRRALWAAFLYLAYLLPLAESIHDDLTGFAARQEALPASVVLVAGVLLAPVAPLLVAFGAEFLSRRFGRMATLCLGALGVVCLLGNGRVLVHDYAGVHLAIALVGLSLLLPVCAGLPRHSASFGVATALVAGWALLGTPAQVGALLSNETAAAASPPLEHLRYRLAPKKRALAADERTRGEWFTSRKNRAAISAHPGPVAAPVVLLVSIDAVRADVIHSGRFDERLPTFAKLRAQGVAFSSARSPATLTKMSIGSLFRGNYYSQQHWSLRRKGLYVPSRDKTTTLPELLARAGVKTSNVRTIAWLTNGPFFRGFDESRLAKDPKSRYADVAAALPELRRAIDAIDERPAFLFTHLSDPHAPYARGKRNDSQFERYIKELELVDRHLAKLLAHVKKRGLVQRTYVIVTSDHGEEFGEHGAFTHGTTLYEPGLRVPLIIVGPHVIAREIRDNVTTLDLFPTILDLFGVPTPGEAMGQSLLGVALGGEPAFTRPIAAETRLLRAWITPENLKLIWDTRSGRVEAYDLTRDPTEEENLFGRGADTLRAFEEFEAFFAAHARTEGGYQPPYFR